MASGRRAVALDPRTVAALRAWRKTQLAERLAWGEGWTDSGLVFTREDGTAVHPEWFSDTFDRRTKAAGLPRIRLHDLRHTHASLGLAAGVPVKVMTEQLGHSTSAFTADVYQHVTPALQGHAAATSPRWCSTSDQVRIAPGAGALPDRRISRRVRRDVAYASTWSARPQR